MKGDAQPALPCIAATLASLGACWLLLSPAVCHEHGRCAAVDAETPRRYHGYIAAGLAVLLAREWSTLVATVVELRGSRGQHPTKDPHLAPLILCVILAVLTAFQAAFTWNPYPTAHVFADGRPVATMRFAEWLISVPLLMALTCRCALGRDLSEATMPIVVTNVYIVASWAAIVVDSVALRWFLVLASFAAYGWASHGMMRWVWGFKAEAPPDAPCRSLRISSAVFLIAVFGWYGVVYLAAIAEVISPHVEQLTYAFCDFGVKLIMTLGFTAIRVMEQQHTLTGLLFKLSGVSSAFMSLLRGSFDFVVPCSADTNGICHLPSVHSDDSRELERCLGRPLLGGTLNELLAGPAEQARFAGYVQNALRQVTSPKTSGAAMWQVLPDAGSCGEAFMPPVSQVLNIKLRCMVPRDDEQESTPRSGASVEGGIINAVAHLSIVPGLSSAGASAGGGPQAVVLGLRLETQDRQAPPTAASELAPTSPRVASEFPAACETAPGPRFSPLANEEDDWKPRIRPVPSPLLCGNSSGGTSSTGCPLPTLLRRRLRLSAGLARAAGKRPGVVATRAARKVRVTARKRGTRAVRLLADWLDRKSRRERQSEKVTSDSVSCTEDKFCAESQGGGASCAEAQAQPFEGGWDVLSQSSRLSHVGSVTLACRQLLGPLHDHLPPKQLVSKRVEDHVQCAAEMVKLRASAKIHKLHHEQKLKEWETRRDGHLIAEMLLKGRVPEGGMDEEVWRTQLLPHLQEPHPGVKPADPQVPDDTELWYQAWQKTYEEDESDSGTEDSSSSMGGPIANAVAQAGVPRSRQQPASRPLLTARTDPRLSW